MNRTKQINYIGNYDKVNPDFWDRLVGFYSKKSYELKPYSFDTKTNTDVLLILNPYSINDIFYDVHLLWVTYFKSNKLLKNTKILVSGFGQECPAYKDNYLSFIDWEEKLDSFLKDLKTIGELPKYKKEHIKRANILKALIDFFQGHNDRSLFQRFNYLEMALKNIHYTTTGEVNRSFVYAIKKMRPIAIDEWKNFENRWRFYRNFLNSTPFTKEGNQIEEAMVFVDDFLKGRKEIEKNNIEAIVTQVAIIRDNLNEMEKYVK